MKVKITIIGAGNVANHLAKRLFEKNHTVLQIFSRSIDNATKLAKTVNAEPVNTLEQIQDKADIYIIAVKDDAIESVSQQLNLKNQLQVHTSGATPSTVLSNHTNRFGVFYPLQTFSKEKKADFEQLPMCIDANNADDLKILEAFAQSICPNVYHINDKERAILHVCAVMVNNFTNHLFAVADDILKQENLSLEVLKPLIRETVSKIEVHPPKSMQTGPAVRNDDNTIQKHIHFLEKYPKYQLLYQLLSDSIRQF
jgi:predicted short-subunit dehydrogenase-like oxidoreductase (DUF2520 family)